MFTDRDIHGRWVAAEGVVFQDFNHNKHYIDVSDISCDEYIVGVDWGYEHYGSLVVLGKKDNTYYLIEEYAERHKEIDYWVALAKDIKNRYGNIMMYADSARPEHVKRFQREGFKCVNANKSIIAGIEEVAKRFKQDTLYISNDVKRFKEEINMYVWNETTGKPVMLYDDVLDAVRYAIYSNENNKGKLRTINKSILGL